MPSGDRHLDRQRVPPFFHRMLSEREHAAEDWARELEAASRRAGRRRGDVLRRRARSDRHS